MGLYFWESFEVGLVTFLCVHLGWLLAGTLGSYESYSTLSNACYFLNHIEVQVQILNPCEGSHKVISA